MGHYKKYSSGNHHLRMDMDHERRLIHDAKDAIYDEDAKLRDRKSAGKRMEKPVPMQMDEKDLDETGSLRPVDADATVMDNKREDKFKK
jgi:hypothetical protein